MAVYKVPQDVEAEDKLIGPFGFRQFIYLLIAGGAGGLTVLFFQVPPPVPFFSVLTVPVALIMILLALPLRKDQPMEIYIAAILKFMLKPKRRLWMNDGTAAGVIIDAPKVIVRQLSKNLSQEEALDKLSYLSRVVDTRGWAAKGVDTSAGGTLVQTATPNPFDAEDVLDNNHGLAKSFDAMLAKQKQASHTAISQLVHNAEQQTPAQITAPSPAAQSNVITQPQAPAPRAAVSATVNPWDRFDTPRLTSEEPSAHPHAKPHNSTEQITSTLDRMRGHTFHTPQTSESAASNSGLPMNQDANKDVTPQVSADKMRLAYNNDLSIQTIANEAHRLEGEVKLR